jgi:hypothetical protein
MPPAAIEEMRRATVGIVDLVKKRVAARAGGPRRRRDGQGALSLG